VRALKSGCWGEKVDRVSRSFGAADGTTMTEFLALLAAVSLAAVRTRADLVAENLLLRQQLAVLSRPTRKRSRLRARDRLF
jgi:hypothetical protein